MTNCFFWQSVAIESLWLLIIVIFAVQISPVLIAGTLFWNLFGYWFLLLNKLIIKFKNWNWIVFLIQNRFNRRQISMCWYKYTLVDLMILLYYILEVQTNLDKHSPKLILKQIQKNSSLAIGHADPYKSGTLGIWIRRLCCEQVLNYIEALSKRTFDRNVIDHLHLARKQDDTRKWNKPELRSYCFARLSDLYHIKNEAQSGNRGEIKGCKF